MEGNRRLATAIWLDVNVDDLEEYRNEGCGGCIGSFIDELKLLKSEQEFREIGRHCEVDSGIQLLGCLGPVGKVGASYGGREELTELKTSARLSYQQHVKSQYPMLSESECLQLFEAYMKFFPGDEIMQRGWRQETAVV